MVSSKHPGIPTPTIAVPPPENQLMLWNVDLRWPLRAALFSPLQQRCSSADPVQISVALFSADLPSASLARLPVIRLDTRRHRLNAALAYNDGFSACCTRRILPHHDAAPRAIRCQLDTLCYSESVRAPLGSGLDYCNSLPAGPS